MGKFLCIKYTVRSPNLPDRSLRSALRVGSIYGARFPLRPPEAACGSETPHIIHVIESCLTVQASLVSIPCRLRGAVAGDPTDYRGKDTLALVKLLATLRAI
jgi:hypothetical protein